MATPTHTLIGAVTVGSGGAAYIEFSSIPSTYSDLKLVCSLRDNRTDTTVTDATISYNGAPGGSNYNNRSLTYASETVSTFASSSSNYLSIVYENSGQATANNFCNFEHYILDYTNSAQKYSSTDSVAEHNSTGVYFGLVGHFKADTAAITSVRVTPYYGTLNYVQNSTAYLYGIKNS